MIHRFIYQQKPVYTQADTALFSKGGFTCIRLYLTKKGKPVALSEGSSAAHYKWRVQYGFSCVGAQLMKNLLQQTTLLPLHKPLVGRLPSAITLWQVTPGCSTSRNP